MSSLADLPELVGFFSYSREDDEGSKGTLSDLRDAIQRELSAQLGRSKRNFRLFQDQEAIAPGKQWEIEITKAIEQAVFFIPIVTPRAVSSSHCKFEFESFLAREQALGRDDLIFPILYISVPGLEDEVIRRVDPVLSIVGKRQYVDWRPYRHLPTDTPSVGQSIERFCSKIVDAFREPWLSPEERRQQEEIEAERRIDEEHKRQAAEAQKRADEEARRQEEEAGAQRRSAEEERRQWEAAEAKKRIDEQARRTQEDAQPDGTAKKVNQEAPEEYYDISGTTTRQTSAISTLISSFLLAFLVAGAATFIIEVSWFSQYSPIVFTSTFIIGASVLFFLATKGKQSSVN